ncbi:putative cation transporter [Elusimicrobium simillimum]|uniref:DUF1646 family protein n=1 Tax=Elusimicrobium simillimum TaxID=3143438 RepID=UPI003C70498C
MSHFTIICLSFIVLLVLILPLTIHKIEENLEPFLLVMGILAVTITKKWSWHLVADAAKDPVMITIAVVVLGFAFRALGKQFRFFMLRLSHKIGFKVTIFLVVLGLGLCSSIITAIVAAVMLAEAVNVLGLKDDSKVHVVVMACFAIGMGAVLTPIGEPLSTITVSKLSGPPHNADFFYLFRILAAFILPGVLISAGMAAFVKQKRISIIGQKRQEKETPAQIIIRSVKVYFFVAALVFLGEGLKPLAEITIFKLSDPVLYWVNSISAILDNATLAAIEIVPAMPTHTIQFLLMGLVLAGGLLIPGNIPNIICASKLNIRSGAWAKKAIPIGSVLMLGYFIIMMLVLPH